MNTLSVISTCKVKAGKLTSALLDVIQKAATVASKNNNYDDNSSLLIFVVLSLSHAKQSV